MANESGMNDPKAALNNGNETVLLAAENRRMWLRKGDFFSIMIDTGIALERTAH
jgi:hypothetical protein